MYSTPDDGGGVKRDGNCYKRRKERKSEKNGNSVKL